jgi:cob(I)alamin adenosyltransferase
MGGGGTPWQPHPRRINSSNATQMAPVAETEGKMNDKQISENKMESMLKEWEQKILELRAKSAIVRPEKKVIYDQQIELMQAKHQELKARLQELKKATPPGEAEALERLNKAWIDFRTAYGTLVVQFEGIHN